MSTRFKKYIVLKTTSMEKFGEIRRHIIKYNIDCRLDFLEDIDPIAILKEHSELIELSGTATIISNLTVEQKDNNEYVIKRIYTSKAHGYMSIPPKEEPEPWGYDAKFIPDGLMTSYYHLKKKGLKISPRDMNIGQFLQDFIHYNPSNWSYKELKVLRPIDLEMDNHKVLFDFFDLGSQQNFIGYDFWKGVVNSAISGGLFIRTSNTRKMNNYWWPVGNAGLPITNKPKDPIHEKVYMMHDIFHYLTPDLLYTGNPLNKNNYEWSYTLHRVMTECFTLVLGDMFYVHYLHINGIKYETMEKRRIYPIFEAIYGKRTNVFTSDILEEVIRASITYGLHGSEDGFINLFIKYNKSDENCMNSMNNFATLLRNFRDKYDFYIIQDLKWTIHNASFMKEHSSKYKYLSQLDSIIKTLGIVSLDSLETEKPDGSKPDIDYFVSIGLEQLRESLSRTDISVNTVLKNKFLRWAIGQLCFFEHYSSIPIIDGNKNKFYDFVECIQIENETEIIYNKIRHFRYQWEYLMDRCVEMQIITLEEAKQFKEVYPIFDPHYISSYEDRTENHSNVMSQFINDFKF